MKKKVFSVFVLLFFFFQAKALIIGSDSLVSLESTVEFPDGESNEIKSFAWMKNGFTFESSSTTMTFKSTFPVQGVVDLKGGTLILDEDLIFKNTTNLQGLGAILGNGHILQFSSSIKALPSTAKTFENITIFFDEDLAVSNMVTFKGDNLVCGNSNPLVFQEGGFLIVDSDSTLHLRDLDIMGLKGDNLRCVDDTGSIILDNVNWIQDDSFTFSFGRINFEDKVTFCGTGTFFYESSQTSTVNRNTHWIFSDALTFQIGRDPMTLNEPMYFEDETSLLTLDNIDFIASTSGITISRGTIVLNRTVNLDTIHTDTQRGIMIGDGNPDHDMVVRLNPGCSIIHRSGYWVYNNGKKDRFQSQSITAGLVRDVGSLIAIHQDLQMPKQTVELLSNYVSPIQVQSGKQLDYKDTHIVLPDIEFSITAHQLSSFVYELNGDDEMFFTKGSMPLALQVRNGSNVVKGNGGINSPIWLTSSLDTLSLGITGELRSSLSLSNGTLKLLAPLKLNNSGIINGPGTVNLSTCETQLSPQVSNWPTTIFWSAEDGALSLPAELSLLETWSFSGKVLLDGHGNSLKLGEQGGIYLKSGSHLVMKDIRLIGVQGSNIMCEDDTAYLSFFNAEWVLDSDYTITLGNLDFDRYNRISGPYTFSMEQETTSTIKKDAHLVFDLGAKLKTGRTDSGKEPLYFDDETAILHLDSGSIVLNSNGITLSRGCVICDKSCTFEFNSTHTGNGLQLGNGVAEDDIMVKLNPGSDLTLKAGHVLQNVTDINKSFVGSNSAQLNYTPGLFVHYIQDGKLANATIDITPPAAVTFEPDKNIYLEKLTSQTPVGTYKITGRRKDIFTIALEGNDEIEILNGSYVQSLFISGSGNVIRGPGNLLGLTTLEGDDASLSFAMSGALSQTILMNNGTVSLTNGLALASGIVLTGPGTVNVSKKFLEIGTSKTTWTTPIKWIGNGGGLGLQSNVDLSSTWTISGDAVIKGRGYTLKLVDDLGQIYLEPSSTLRFEDLKLEGVKGHNICCAADDSVVTFANTTIKTDEAFTFTAGAFRVHNKANFTGSGVFAYESTQTSTICSESQIRFDTNFTFSFYPTDQNPDLLCLEDETANFILRGALLNCGLGGMKFQKGNFIVRDGGFILAEINDEDEDNIIDEGITLGDGTESNDCMIEIATGASLNFSEGSFRYRNVKSSSLKMDNNLSRFYFAKNTSLHVHESMNLGLGHLVYHPAATVIIDDGKSLIGAILVKE